MQRSEPAVVSYESDILVDAIIRYCSLPSASEAVEAIPPEIFLEKLIEFYNTKQLSAEQCLLAATAIEDVDCIKFALDVAHANFDAPIFRNQSIFWIAIDRGKRRAIDYFIERFGKGLWVKEFENKPAYVWFQEWAQQNDITLVPGEHGLPAEWLLDKADPTKEFHDAFSFLMKLDKENGLCLLARARTEEELRNIEIDRKELLRVKKPLTAPASSAFVRREDDVNDEMVCFVPKRIYGANKYLESDEMSHYLDGLPELAALNSMVLEADGRITKLELILSQCPTDIYIQQSLQLQQAIKRQFITIIATVKRKAHHADLFGPMHKVLKSLGLVMQDESVKHMSAARKAAFAADDLEDYKSNFAEQYRSLTTLYWLVVSDDRRFYEGLSEWNIQVTLSSIEFFHRYRSKDCFHTYYYLLSIQGVISFWKYLNDTGKGSTLRNKDKVYERLVRFIKSILDGDEELASIFYQDFFEYCLLRMVTQLGDIHFVKLPGSVIGNLEHILAFYTEYMEKRLANYLTASQLKLFFHNKSEDSELYFQPLKTAVFMLSANVTLCLKEAGALLAQEHVALVDVKRYIDCALQHVALMQSIQVRLNGIDLGDGVRHETDFSSMTTECNKEIAKIERQYTQYCERQYQQSDSFLAELTKEEEAHRTRIENEFRARTEARQRKIQADYAASRAATAVQPDPKSEEAKSEKLISILCDTYYKVDGDRKTQCVTQLLNIISKDTISIELKNTALLALANLYNGSCSPFFIELTILHGKINNQRDFSSACYSINKSLRNRLYRFFNVESDAVSIFSQGIDILLSSRSALAKIKEQLQLGVLTATQAGQLESLQAIVIEFERGIRFAESLAQEAIDWIEAFRVANNRFFDENPEASHQSRIRKSSAGNEAILRAKRCDAWERTINEMHAAQTKSAELRPIIAETAEIVRLLRAKHVDEAIVVCEPTDAESIQNRYIKFVKQQIKQQLRYFRDKGMKNCGVTGSGANLFLPDKDCHFTKGRLPDADCQIYVRPNSSKKGLNEKKAIAILTAEGFRPTKYAWQKNINGLLIEATLVVSSTPDLTCKAGNPCPQAIQDKKRAVTCKTFVVGLKEGAEPDLEGDNDICIYSPLANRTYTDCRDEDITLDPAYIDCKEKNIKLDDVNEIDAQPELILIALYHLAFKPGSHLTAETDTAIRQWQEKITREPENITKEQRAHLAAKALSHIGRFQQAYTDVPPTRYVQILQNFGLTELIWGVAPNADPAKTLEDLWPALDAILHSDSAASAAQYSDGAASAAQSAAVYDGADQFTLFGASQAVAAGARAAEGLSARMREKRGM